MLNHDLLINISKRFLYVWIGSYLSVVCAWLIFPAIINNTNVSIIVKILLLIFAMLAGFYTMVFLDRTFTVIKTLKSKNHFISLNDEDFTCLVRGGVLEITSITNETYNIMLKDIGFLRMKNSIEMAIMGNDIHEPRKRSQ